MTPTLGPPPMRPLSRLLPLLSLPALIASSLGAAEKPLGLVDRVETGASGVEVILRFDPKAGTLVQGLAPGRMLSIYGPGQVEKHPLTDEVIITRPALVAKAQLVQNLGGTNGLRARVVWTAGGQTVGAGMDAVPMPQEAAPNAPPALMKDPIPVSVAQGTAVSLRLVVADPDGDPLAYSWSLEGPVGRSGRLLERTTTVPEVTWIAPLADGSVELVGVARDPLEQLAKLRLRVSTTAPGDQAGDLRPYGRWGGDQEPAVRQLSRSTDGRWLGITDAPALGSASLVRFAPGWTGAEILGIAVDQVPKKPVALLSVGPDLHILDGAKGQVLVLGPDLAVKRSYGACEKPTGFAVAPDGTAFITDTAAGGVLVHEADGRLRCRLGGPGAGGFIAPMGVALGVDGTIFVLDAGTQSVQRFDRFLRRLDPLPLANEPNDPALGLAVHPLRKILVLRTSGRLEIPGGGTVPADLGRLGVLDPGKAGAVWVDGAGESYVSYPESGLIARYDRELALSGVRGGKIHQGSGRACDGQGRTFALDAAAGTVLMLDTEGWLVGKLGAREQVGGTLAKPKAIACAPDGSALAVLDAGRNAIHRFNPQDPAKPPATFSQAGEAPGSLKDPVDLTLDEAGRTYVLDAGTYRVTVFAPDGSLLFTFGHKGKQADGLYDPERIAVSPDGSRCWVYDSYNYDLKQFTLDQTAKTGTFAASGGSKGNAPGQFRSVVGLDCDRQNRLYILDDSRNDLQVLDFTTGALTPLAAKDRTALGLGRLDQLAVAPDGTVLISGADQTSGWRW